MDETTLAATEALLRNLDPVMDTAMAHNDVTTLEALLADDFIYTHSNNNHQAKREFIDAIGSRKDPPRRDLTEIEAEVHGGIAVTRGNLDVVYSDGRTPLVFRYVRVYRLDNGNWRPFSHRTLYAKDRES